MFVMKRVMDIVPVDVDDPDNQWAPFTLMVQDPGKVRMITTVLKAPSSIIQTALGKATEPQPIPVPALVIESDPEGEKRRRHYLWLVPGIKITYPGNLEFRATYIDELTRNPMFLYEAFPDPDKKR